MKRLIQYFLFCAIAVMGVSLSSCENRINDPYYIEDEISYYLAGTWEGSTEGRYVGDDYYTTIRFNRLTATSGTGYEVDEHQRYWEAVTVKFDWYVNGRRIYLNYSDGARIEIYDYSLGSNYFNGYLDDYRTGVTKARFSWRKVSNRYDDWVRW